jgi:hypothetical protein
VRGGIVDAQRSGEIVDAELGGAGCSARGRSLREEREGGGTEEGAENGLHDRVRLEGKKLRLGLSMRCGALSSNENIFEAE